MNLSKTSIYSEYIHAVPVFLVTIDLTFIDPLLSFFHVHIKTGTASSLWLKWTDSAAIKLDDKLDWFCFHYDSLEQQLLVVISAQMLKGDITDSVKDTQHNSRAALYKA